MRPISILNFFLALTLTLFVDCHPNWSLPPTFDEKVLPYGQRNGQWIDRLGHIIALDTVLPAKSLEKFTTKFTIFKRGLTDGTEIVFSPGKFCFQDSCFGPYEYNLSKMRLSGFNIDRPTILLISGYLTNDHVEWEERIRDLWLKLDDVNVILVSWSSTNRLIYSTAVANAPLVSRQITIFLYYLAELNGSHLNDTKFTKRIHFIGHSLGAHVAGFVGQDLAGNLGRITGLDPAGPSFDKLPREKRLDLGDALFVEVIHTNSGKMKYVNAMFAGAARTVDLFAEKLPIISSIRGSLVEDYTGEGDTAWHGIDAQVGHVDYYANNGRNQPGCKGLMHTCDHGRAHEIYEDILQHEVHLREHYQKVINHDAFSPEHDQKQKDWLKQNRLLAFNSIDYSSFLIGDNFNVQCPNLLYGRDHLERNFDETFKYCSIPIDPITPVEELREELANDYNVNFEDGVNYQRARKYYFNTQRNKPLVGDHNILKIEFDENQTRWNEGCSLKVNVTMATGRNVEFTLNKNFQMISTNEFHGIAIPFVNPNSYKARTALNVILAAIRNNEFNTTAKSQVTNLIAEIIPKKVDLELTGPSSTGIFEAIKNKIRNIGFKSKASKSCQLEIISAEIYPIIGQKQNVVGLYGSVVPTKVNDPYPPVLVPSEKRTKLIRHKQSLTADPNNSKLSRELGALVLG